MKLDIYSADYHSGIQCSLLFTVLIIDLFPDWTLAYIGISKRHDIVTHITAWGGDKKNLAVKAVFNLTETFIAS